MAKTIVGVDNGTSGALTIIGEDKVIFIKTPIKHEKSYTKKPQTISRIDFNKLTEFLRENIKDPSNCLAVLERPLINPRKFKTTQSAMRSLEATLICLESFGIEGEDSPVKAHGVAVRLSEHQRGMAKPGIKGISLGKGHDANLALLVELSFLVCEGGGEVDAA